MSHQRYIGIENEFISFDLKGNKRNFGSFHNKLFNNIEDTSGRYFSKSSTSIRTGKGNGFYVDGAEIEILTPPTVINKGFTSRLTDSLMIGRDELVKGVPDLNHTGYSMHWNLSLGNCKRESYYELLAVPFQLFGLNPLSKGFNVRSKSNRIEILGDSIVSEDQINATGLLLGASQYAIEEYKSFPFKLFGEQYKTGNSSSVFIPNGRSDRVFIKDVNSDKVHYIKVQEFLEKYYEWISPFVSELGNELEIKNLKAFIEGNKDLEYDMFKHFSYLKNNKGYDDGILKPIKMPNGKLTDRVITLSSNPDREIPLEARLLGVIANDPGTSSMEWSSVCGNYTVPIGEKTKFENIEPKSTLDIYNLGSLLLNSNNEYDLKSLELDSFDVDKLSSHPIDFSSKNKIDKTSAKRKYKFKDDKFDYETDSIGKEFLNLIKFSGIKKISKDILFGSFLFTGISFGAGAFFNSIYNESESQRQLEQFREIEENDGNNQKNSGDGKTQLIVPQIENLEANE